ncbi:hypothetical protein [Spiroplasma platyhelix]|uniref:Transmembrane protein n=1 Tax=Spiroplasma platyhelix PALS-1 TaxID=1276218 RepID=A0A846U177_9MOLU|nr:hypothetical protein [Spiroplasma platyhelix]MBE4704392.1 hypothetical protein [Spiroplasma platyhelix PALS-1]NKE38764.1 hypothetical protein [Spiroplasma platyhelix PALS-1]UJB28975.1 hypothetical protein SPLAT_v1c02100 [Spiroplasma platyhelix PALS-1]
MAQFKIIYYIVLVMSFLLIAVFLWGAVTYKKSKSNVRFLNRPLLALTLSIAAVSFILAWIPIIMKVWAYDDEFVRSDPAFISILVFEFIFLIAFLVLAYVFAFDFGMTLEQDTNRLQFFGQTVNTEKIIALEEKPHCLKIVYEQGFKNIKKKITIFSPKARLFAKEILTDIVAANQSQRAAALAIENIETTDSTQNVELEQN